jgi:hypothetical protein
MSLNYGTAHPDKIDLIGESNGTCLLWIVQSEPLDEENLLLLQEKINYYLTFILDGQLAEEFPERSDMPKMVRVVYQHDLTEIVTDFLEKVRSVFCDEGIVFEYGSSEF